jgi:hypothetical protein
VRLWVQSLVTHAHKCREFLRRSVRLWRGRGSKKRRKRKFTAEETVTQFKIGTEKLK